MIELLFFAQLQEKVGSKSLTLQAENMSILEIKETFLKKYEMDDLLQEAMVAVNEEYCEDETIVQAGDVVAFIPPVSGG